MAPSQANEKGREEAVSKGRKVGGTLWKPVTRARSFIRAVLVPQGYGMRRASAGSSVRKKKGNKVSPVRRTVFCVLVGGVFFAGLCVLRFA